MPNRSKETDIPPREATECFLENELHKIRQDATVDGWEVEPGYVFRYWDMWDSSEWVKAYSDEDCHRILQQSPPHQITQSNAVSFNPKDYSEYPPTWSAILHHITGKVLKEILIVQEAKEWHQKTQKG